MKTKQPLLVISIIFIFSLACQTLAKPFATENNTPAQTQETISQPTATINSTETPAESSSYTVTEITDDNGVSMVLVPEGTFNMGSDNGELDESPVHTVYLDSYYIDKYEVINAHYKTCVDAGACNKLPITRSYNRDSGYYGISEFDNYPVISVTWDVAKTYCEWRGAQLPTEAQWEKAAGGVDGRTYPWGEEIDETFSNYNTGDTVEVGSFESGASPYGAYDMAGNVAGWVADWHSETYYQNSPSSNPLGPDDGFYRVVRGGAWSSNANLESSAFRGEF